MIWAARIVIWFTLGLGLFAANLWLVIGSGISAVLLGVHIDKRREHNGDGRRY